MAVAQLQKSRRQVGIQAHGTAVQQKPRTAEKQQQTIFGRIVAVVVVPSESTGAAVEIRSEFAIRRFKKHDSNECQ